jgi:hypothetical protein
MLLDFKSYEGVEPQGFELFLLFNIYFMVRYLVLRVE